MVSITAPVSKLSKLDPSVFWVCKCPASAEYCCKLASAPDFSMAAIVAAGKCFMKLPCFPLNISIKAWRAVCGAAESGGNAHTEDTMNVDNAMPAANFLTEILLAGMILPLQEAVLQLRT